MADARKHHFVPRFHLAAFAHGQRRELEVFDKRWGKLGLVASASAARVRDYYLIPGATAGERLAVERDFGRLENLVAPLMRRLDAAATGSVLLSESDRHNLAAYIAILHVRVPAYRDDALLRVRELAKDPEALGLSDATDFRLAARRLGLPGSDQQLEDRRLAALEALRSGTLSIKVPRTASLGGLTPAINKGLPLLLERDWEVLRATTWPGFILGDQPVTLFSHGLLAPSIGFGSPDVQVFVPLSPRSLLLISSRQRSGLPLQIKEDPGGSLRDPWWAFANKVAWLTAQRYVWGRRADLQATESLIPEDQRRLDLRVLDPAQESRRQRVAQERRAERRRATREGAQFE